MKVSPVRKALELGVLTLSSALVSSCSSPGPIEAPRGACAAVGGLIGGISAEAAADSQTDEDGNVVLAAVAGTVLGELIGALFCGREAQPPRVALSVTPRSGDAPLRVELTGTASDADGRVVGYAWDFGDGTRGEGARVIHLYITPGRYQVRLTVTDDDRLAASAFATVDAMAAVAAQPEPLPRRITLQGVTFAFDSADIRPEDAPLLDFAAEQLRGHASGQVRIVGHTDDAGREDYNQRLSERRAQSVAEYLGRSGIGSERLEIVGRGENEPVTSNETADGRAQNRRVEIDVRE